MTYVTTDGKIIYFCSSKCRKNALKLHRDKLKVNWVKKAEWNAAEVAAKSAASREYEAKKTAEAVAIKEAGK